MNDHVAWLNSPTELFTSEELLAPEPKQARFPGLYVWYIKGLPSFVPTSDCVAVGEFRLCYLGISPSRPDRPGAAPTKQSVYKRLRGHLRGNASGSTLRLTLGSILAPQLNLELRKTGTRDRLTFGPEGELELSRWMATHSRLCVLEHRAPWTVEANMIEAVSLPLNLRDNDEHRFHAELTRRRRALRERARKSHLRW